MSNRQSEARKLRELFRGRFDQETAEKLIDDLGGVPEAVDFILNEDEAQVSTFLKQSPSYLQNIRTDSENLASILSNKIQESVRQFVCGDCKRSWWCRVPLRKEVSRCRRCRVKLDPIPREFEFGIGKFLCPCGNEFTGFARMGETVSKCYECGENVPVAGMQPPRRNRDKKSSAPHSCNGVNCFNSDHNHDGDKSLSLDAQPYSTMISLGATRGGRGGKFIKKLGGDHYTVLTFDDPPECVHPKSSKTKVRHVSKKHVSTGSTVSTFLSQGSLDDQSISVASSLYSINE